MVVFNGKNQVIWTLRVKLPQIQSECVRVIEIKSTATFLELHEAIQDAVDFDNDHLFEFFMIKRLPDCLPGYEHLQWIQQQAKIPLILFLLFPEKPSSY